MGLKQEGICSVSPCGPATDSTHVAVDDDPSVVGTRVLGDLVVRELNHGGPDNRGASKRGEADARGMAS